MRVSRSSVRSTAKLIRKIPRSRRVKRELPTIGAHESKREQVAPVGLGVPAYGLRGEVVADERPGLSALRRRRGRGLTLAPGVPGPREVSHAMTVSPLQERIDE